MAERPGGLARPGSVGAGRARAIRRCGDHRARPDAQAEAAGDPQLQGWRRARHRHPGRRGAGGARPVHRSLRPLRVRPVGAHHERRADRGRHARQGAQGPAARQHELRDHRPHRRSRHRRVQSQALARPGRRGALPPHPVPRRRREQAQGRGPRQARAEGPCPSRARAQPPRPDFGRFPTRPRRWGRASLYGVRPLATTATTVRWAPGQGSDPAKALGRRHIGAIALPRDWHPTIWPPAGDRSRAPGPSDGTAWTAPGRPLRPGCSC